MYIILLGGKEDGKIIAVPQLQSEFYVAEPLRINYFTPDEEPTFQPLYTTLIYRDTGRFDKENNRVYMLDKMAQ